MEHYEQKVTLGVLCGPLSFLREEFPAQDAKNRKDRWLTGATVLRYN